MMEYFWKFFGMTLGILKDGTITTTEVVVVGISDQTRQKSLLIKMVSILLLDLMKIQETCWDMKNRQDKNA